MVYNDVMPFLWLVTTVRLKYDDTHSDQKFSENGVWPLIVWKRPRDAYETPTKRLRKASSLRGNAPSVRGNAYETPKHWGGRVNFQRISGQNR